MFEQKKSNGLKGKSLMNFALMEKEQRAFIDTENLS